MPDWRPSRNRATCHPDRPVHSQGLCNSCYQRGRKRPKNTLKATCHPKRPHQAKGLCKPCYMAQHRLEYEKRPAQVRKRRVVAWRARGINCTFEQYEMMLKEQNGTCAICERPPQTTALRVDHDYDTGIIRGLLCDYCNRRLLIRRNTVEILQRAVDYLTKKR